MIFAPRTNRSQLWLALLIASTTMLLLLAAMLWQQTRPVRMHDLHLAEGEKLRCVSYAPYHRPGQTPLLEDTRIEREQIAADLAALAKITDCVRLYSIDQGLEHVPELARPLGLKVLLGAWIGYEKTKNARELERAIALANANADVVRALIVGNEVLLRRERTEDEMRELIRHAKAHAKVPVTYADVWEFWTRHDSLANEVDFVTVHILPFWEDEPVDIELALQHVAETRRHVGEHFAGKKILIGETGWPSAGRQREESKPSRVNQARYIREFVHRAHAEGWDYNLIEAIDQPWKRRLEGTVGGFWGMLDADSLEPKFPLAGAVAGRGLDLSPRVVVPEQFRFVGHVAALIAVCQGLAQVRYLGGDLDLAALADALDAEASRNHPSHDAYGAPAKTLAERFRACAPVFCGDSPAGDALAQRAAGTLFAIGGVCGSAVDLSAAMTRMLRDVGSTPVDSIFHDPEIDGPVPSRARLFVLSTPGQQWLARRRVAALPDAETLVGSAPDSPDASADPGAPPSGDEGPDALVSQLVLAARLEMAAVYADLLGAG